MRLLNAHRMMITWEGLASALRRAAGEIGALTPLLAGLILTAMTALPAAPAAAQCTATAPSIAVGDPTWNCGTMTPVGNGTATVGADGVPPLVIIGGYPGTSLPPSPPPPTSSGLFPIAGQFPSAGQVTAVQFEGSAMHSFTVYALSVNPNYDGSGVGFNVDAEATFNSTTNAPCGNDAACNQTIAVAPGTFVVPAGDVLAFSGVGPYYAQQPNNAAGSDATYANATTAETNSFAACYTATAPGAVGTQFSVGAEGNANTNYDYICNAAFGNQGRSYSFGVLYTPTANYTIGGTLTGMSGSGPVVLQDNGGDNLTLTANGAFTFATPLASGQSYNVTVLTQPQGQFCTVSNGSGTVASSNVTNVSVNCGATTTYTYTGMVFNMFECATSPNPDCASPGPGNPYTATNSVTAAVTMSTPLGANLPPTNLIYTPGFVSLTMNDGQHTISVTPPPNGSCNGEFCNGSAYVTTDGNGNINAWWLDSTFYQQGGNPQGEDIHTLYDPNHVIGASCEYCYEGSYDPQGKLPNALGEDEGSFSVSNGETNVFYYGYENDSPPGSFLPPGTGGSTVVTATTCTEAAPCQLTPTTTLAVILAPGVTLPSGAVISQTQCFVPADPRGPNCGAVGGKPPRSLNISSLPQCAGFGNEIIPNYACGATATAGNPAAGIPAETTGFWLDYGVAESLDATNGLNIDTGFTLPPPGLYGAYTPPQCPPPNGTGVVGTYTNSIIIAGTRNASNTEEQHPEGTLINISAWCDRVHGMGPPGGSMVGQGLMLRQSDPAAKYPATNLQLLTALANYEYVNLDIVLALVNFPRTSPVRKQLFACSVKAQLLLNSGKYDCSAQQIYQCEQILESTPVSVVGPATTPLRLSDPYGDLKARWYAQYFLTNTGIAGNAPTSLAQVPAGGPYASMCPSH